MKHKDRNHTSHILGFGEVDKRPQSQYTDYSHTGSCQLKQNINVKATHKAPTPNINKTPTFFFVDMCNFQICVIGSAKVTQSMTIPIPACAKAKSLLLTHCPWCSPSHWVQAKLIGEQTNTAAIVHARVDVRLTAIHDHTTVLKLFKGKFEDRISGKTSLQGRWWQSKCIR